MPDLPTLTVTQEQANRMIAAFGPPGGTTEQAIANYKEWLKEAIIEYVIEKESGNRARDFYEQDQETRRSTRTQLGGTNPPNI
jgi:hypothetical protein